MSILQGLRTQSEIVSSKSNMINSYSAKTDTNLKLSTVYAHGYKQYAYKTNQNDGAKFPMQNENIDLSTKPSYKYSLVCRDSVSDNIIDPDNLVFEVKYVNGLYEYSVNKTDTSFDMVFENLPSFKAMKMTLRITGENYLESFAQITSDPSVVVHTQEIGMVNLNNLPDGVGVEVVSLTQGENGTNGVSTITVPSSESKYEYSTFTVPNGTKFYDRDGNRLNGDINVTIGHFSPTNNTSLSLFNTGWEVSNIVLDGRQLSDNESVTFVSAGFFVVDVVDDSGNIAYSINNDGLINASPIVCKTSVNPELINPLTDNPYAVGDTIPFWRLKDGVWEVESTAVVKNESGTLIMEFTTTGFSYANIDQHIACQGTNTRSGYRLPVPDPSISQLV